MKVLKLKQEFVEQLQNTPENGMGHHIVDVYKPNGKVLEKRVVLNCTFLKLEDTEKMDNNKITKIEISK